MIRSARSMLFVPSGSWSMIAKAASTAADGVCLDLEDSVPADQKDSARTNIVRALGELDFGRRTILVRINGLETAHAYRDIIDIAEGAGARVDLLMVPKVSGPSDVQFVATLLAQIEARKSLARPIGLEVQIETAKGFLWLREIASASPRLESLIFGAGDYAASMQMPADGIGVPDANDELYPGHRWHAVMHAIVAAARANGLRCMDGPYGAHTDVPGFEQSCRVARAMGFDGKQCIHPAQLAIANAVFSPTPHEVERATQVTKAYDAAVAAGRGAVALDGQMIDEANVRMARVVLARAAQLQSAR
jgi:citrate lyase subunit beta/citryl-CoA lyase